MELSDFSSNSTRHRKIVAWKLAALVVVWGVSTLFGMTQLVRYSGVISSHGRQPDRLPDLPFEVPANKNSVLLFLHPQCPCTFATVRNLERVLALAPDAPNIFVVAYRPSTTPARWDDSAAESLAAKLPNATVFRDIDGRLAQQFCVSTSGHVVAYSAERHLIFSGGVTPSRGHEGPCDGARELRQALSGETPPSATAPVFGCGFGQPSCGSGSEECACPR